MATRVYSYGGKTPIRGLKEIGEQMELARSYYNELIAMERQRRLDYRERCRTQSHELVDLALMIEGCVGVKIDAKAQAGEERVVAMSRKGATEETRDIVKLAKSDLKMLWSDFNALVADERERDKKFDKDIRALDEKCNEDALEIRHKYIALNLYWGTYNAAYKSFEQARKSHHPPHFRKEYGVGQIDVQIINGLPAADVFGNDTQLQIDPIAMTSVTAPCGGCASWDATRGERRAAARVNARIRVCSDDRGHPIWVELPIVMHRPLPADAIIMEARLVVRRVASHMAYSLQVAVREKAKALVEVTPETSVGIDLGWRWQDEVRVAYAYDGTGEHGPVSFGNDVASALDHANSLRSIRDKSFDSIKATFSEWLKTHQSPEWLLEGTKSMAQWKRQGHLASLIIAWRTQHFDGDLDIFTTLEAWRAQDKHLWEWEVNERRKALARRTEMYRIWAAKIANTYSLVVIEDFDLRDSAKKPPVEEEGEYDDLARSQRIVSAPSLLRGSLINACSSRGVLVVKVPCEKTTITCHSCGQETIWEKAKYLCHRCECGVAWDQDYNAAVNILRAGLAVHKREAARMIRKLNKPFVGRFQRRKLEKHKRERKELKEKLAAKRLR